MRKVRLHIVLFVVGVMCASLANAADVTVTASVDRTRVALGDYISYTVKISGSNLSGIDLLPMDFPDFTVVNRSGPMSQTIIINRQVENNIVYSWKLAARKKGTFEIPPARARYKGKIYASQPIKIEIGKSMDEGLPTELADKNIVHPYSQNSELDTQLKNRVFLLTLVSKSDPYVGEPFEVSYYLYNDGVALQDFGIAAEPEFKKNFLTGGMYQARSIDFRSTALGGRRYNVALVRTLTLVPMHPGNFDLESFALQSSIRVRSSSSRRSRGIFDDDFFGSVFDDPFFSGNRTQIIIPSSLATVKVKPLPEGKPPDFTGTVGEYTMSASVDKASVTTDDIVTLRIGINGKGYLDSIAAPEVSVLDTFSLIDTSANVVPKEGRGELEGTKQFEFLLRPKQTGDLDLPALSYSIFNPTTSLYETLNTKPITLSVAQGKEKGPLLISAAPSQNGGREGGIVEIGKGLNYIKLRGFQMTTGTVYLFANPWYAALHAAPLLAILMSLLIRMRREKLESNVALARHIKARNVAGRRLRKARNALGSKNAELFHTELAKALRGYLGDKLNRSMVGLHIEETADMLEEKGIEEDLIRKAERLLERCERSRYAPGETTPEALKQDYKDASDLINELERRL